MTSSFSERHLVGESVHSSSVVEIVTGDYDYVLLASSWDQRCIAIASSSMTADTIQLFLPTNHGTNGLRDLHDPILKSFALERADQCDSFEDDSEELDRVFGRIASKISDVRKRLDRPIRMLVDLSACPRFFTLGAIALGLNANVAHTIDVLYAEGQYGEVLSSSAAAPPSGLRAWEPVAVPGLEGDWFPGRRRHFLVSVGFDGAQIARVVDRWDPDALSVVFPAPGVVPGYEERTRDANAGWMNHLGVGTRAEVVASPADAISVWRELSQSTKIDESRDNVYGVLAGPKPHALGLALYSLSREAPAVLYLRPMRHEERQIAPLGKFWRYRIRDRSVVYSATAPA